MNKFMRIVVFFDLPVVTAKEKKDRKIPEIFDKRWVQYDAVVRVFKNL